MKRRRTLRRKNPISVILRGISDGCNDRYRECTSCFEVGHLTPLTCQHQYCAPCMERLIKYVRIHSIGTCSWSTKSNRTAMTDEEYFPPSCCRQIVSDQSIRSSLSAKDWATYQAKAKEYSTPLEDRLYCPRSNCRKFLQRHFLWNFLRTVRCPHCHQQIVNFQHGEIRRRKDPLAGDVHLDDTLQLSRRSGWRRCFRCRNMIERVSGCRRMYCPCGAHICYVCGARWGSCACGSKHVEQPQRARRVRPTPEPDLAAQHLAKQQMYDRRSQLMSEIKELRRSDGQLQALEGEQQSIKTRLAALRENLEQTSQLSAEILIVRARIVELNHLWESDFSRDHPL